MVRPFKLGVAVGAWPTLTGLANLKIRLASSKRMYIKALANLANLANLFFSRVCAGARACAQTGARARARAHMGYINRLSRLSRLASSSNTKGCSWPTLLFVGWPWGEGWPKR